VTAPVVMPPSSAAAHPAAECVDATGHTTLPVAIFFDGRCGEGWRWQVAVGHMAHFQEHWEAVQTWLGQEQVIPWNRSISAVAKHVSSSDPLGTTAAAKTAISKNPAVQRALCFLLLPDFINFGCARCGSRLGHTVSDVRPSGARVVTKRCASFHLTANSLARWGVRQLHFLVIHATASALLHRPTATGSGTCSATRRKRCGLLVFVTRAESFHWSAGTRCRPSARRMDA
jgi:hypothetical protein